MNESQYTQAVMRNIPNTILKWKINASFAKGVPDAYFSGDDRDIWVDFKYLHKLPKRLN